MIDLDALEAEVKNYPSMAEDVQLDKLLALAKDARELAEFYSDEFNHGVGLSVFKKTNIQKDFGAKADAFLDKHFAETKK